MKTLVINAAGGNPTAIRTIKNVLTRKNYERFGSELMLETEKYGIEQAGFLLQKTNGEFHFEMSGGEFCGNAARSAALVISQITGKSENSFTMSGYLGTVQSNVTSNKYVRCVFEELPILKQKASIDGIDVTVVDLGGIVHVVVEDEFPKKYEAIHNKITHSLNLKNRDAVGVIWIKRNSEGVKMDPVVWVKSINTFFYETACGSGTIAVSATTGKQRITQPSGQDIVAIIKNNTVVLESEMEIVFEEKEAVQYFHVSDLSSKYKDKFISLYKDVFFEAPYFEEYEDSWVEEYVWNFHINEGCLFLALNKDNVVGFGGAVPLVKDKKIFEFLKEQHDLPFVLDYTFYMSELGVSSLFRKSDFHIGAELVRKRIEYAKKTGFTNYIMRTAKDDSNSKSLYLNTIEAIELQGIVQNVEEKPEEVPSASKQRIYLYGGTN